MNNKCFGKKKNFAYIKQDLSCIYISYGKKDLDELYSTWYEIHYYKKHHPSFGIEKIKRDIISNIEENVKEKILRGLLWNNKPVWLSLENQSNFSMAEHRATTIGDNLPYTEKIGELEDGTAVYHTFETAAELTDFWKACQNHINACRQEGWEIKDNTNWNEYDISKYI